MKATYSQRPLPETFYIPGRSPHPAPSPLPGPWDAADWRHLSDWLYGIDLFNHGYFWEAHEAWEGLWQCTPKTQAPGLLLRGLIQAAACLLKVREDNARGVALLGARSLATLDQVECERLMGLEPIVWREDLREYLTGRKAASYPRLALVL